MLTALYNHFSTLDSIKVHLSLCAHYHVVNKPYETYEAISKNLRKSNIKV